MLTFSLWRRLGSIQYWHSFMDPYGWLKGSSTASAASMGYELVQTIILTSLWLDVRGTYCRTHNSLNQLIMLSKVLLKRSGSRHPLISSEDQYIFKYSAALNSDNPLLNKVWYEIQLHFEWRRREGKFQSENRCRQTWREWSILLWHLAKKQIIVKIHWWETEKI